MGKVTDQAGTGVRTEPARAAKPTAVVGWSFLVVSYLINAMDRQVFYPLLPEISAEHHFSLSQGGLLATGFTLGIAAAGLPAGYLVDRLSRKAVLTISVFVYSLGTLVTPLATGFADMAVYRVVSGIGEGMQAAALYAVASTFFFNRRSLAFGALGVVFGAGVFFGPLIGTSIAQAAGTWHIPFFVFGAAGLLITAAIGLGVSPSVTEKAPTQTQRQRMSTDHLPASAYNRNTIILGIAAMAGGLVFYGYLALYPTYLRSQLHYTPTEAALAISIVGAGAATSIFSGWLGDRVNQRKMLLVTYLGTGVSGWLLFHGSPSHGWQYTLSFTFGVFIAGSMFTNVNSTMQRSVRTAHVGRAAGLFVTSYYAAAAISGFIFAQLVAGLGWQTAALWQLTILPLAILVPLWFLDSAAIVSRLTGPPVTPDQSR